MAKSWYQTGNDGWKTAKKEQEEAKARRAGNVFRYRLDNDESGNLIFLDSPAFFCREHNIPRTRRGKQFFDQETCLRDFDTCPLCEEDYSGSYICGLSVLDLRGYEDKKGVKHKVSKKLFVAKSSAQDKLKRQLEKRDNDLKYTVYEVARGSGDKEPATGDDFEYKGRLTKAKLIKKLKEILPDDVDVEKYILPLDYKEIFKPKPAKELRKLIGAGAPVGSSDDDDGAEEKEKEAEIPFDLDGDDKGDEDEASIDDLL